MSEAINPTGSPGPSPPVALYAAAQVAAAQTGSGSTAKAAAPTTVASAEVQSIQHAAESSQAAKLDFSPQSGVSNKDQNSPAGVHLRQ